MTLVDEERFHLITAYFKNLKTYKAAGGSAGNAIGALASLGASTGFIGKVGADSYGDFLKGTLEAKGIEDHLLVSSALPTGIASTFISRSDGERTFGTYLGAAAHSRPYFICSMGQRQFHPFALFYEKDPENACPGN